MNPGAFDNMIAYLSQSIVFFFGLVVCLLSIWAMFVPGKLRQLVSFTTNQTWGYYFAAAVRFLLGSVLILAASGSRVPATFQVIGWLAILAGVGLLVVGQERLGGFVEWFNRFSDTVFRLWLVVAVVFGCLLIYGVT